MLLLIVGVWFGVAQGLSLLGPGGAVLLAVGLCAAAEVLSRRRRERRRRAMAGLCEDCGYDLRASFDLCQECGAAIPEELARRRRIAARRLSPAPPPPLLTDPKGREVA